MSIQEGITCDLCEKSNFRGLRYKCLVCYDYDLCSHCYELPVTSSHHKSTHSMQCIAPIGDLGLYFGGENEPFKIQSFACPSCKQIGFSADTLKDHFAVKHPDEYEVLCPICPTESGGDINHVTDDLELHITLEHKYRLSKPKELLEEAALIPLPSGSSGESFGRGLPFRRVSHSARVNNLKARFAIERSLFENIGLLEQASINSTPNNNSSSNSSNNNNSNVNLLSTDSNTPGSLENFTEPYVDLLPRINTAKTEIISFTNYLKSLEMKLSLTKHQLERVKKMQSLQYVLNDEFLLSRADWPSLTQISTNGQSKSSKLTKGNLEEQSAGDNNAGIMDKNNRTQPKRLINSLFYNKENNESDEMFEKALDDRRNEIIVERSLFAQEILLDCLDSMHPVLPSENINENNMISRHVESVDKIGSGLLPSILSSSENVSKKGGNIPNSQLQHQHPTKMHKTGHRSSNLITSILEEDKKAKLFQHNHSLNNNQLNNTNNQQLNHQYHNHPGNFRSQRNQARYSSNLQPPSINKNLLRNHRNQSGDDK